MIKDETRIMDFKHSEDYDDADDQMDQPRKRTKFISKSRPTFLSGTILGTNTTETQQHMTDKEIADNILRNFCYQNRKELGDKVQFNDTVPHNEFQRQDSEVTIRNWLDMQMLESGSKDPFELENGEGIEPLVQE
jgi:hypothetical protein